MGRTSSARGKGRKEKAGKLKRKRKQRVFFPIGETSALICSQALVQGKNDRSRRGGEKSGRGREAGYQKKNNKEGRLGLFKKYAHQHLQRQD